MHRQSDESEALTFTKLRLIYAVEKSGSSSFQQAIFPTRYIFKNMKRLICVYIF